MAVTRPVVLDDLTPRELAELFCDMGSDEQAEVFNEIAAIARTWPGAGWCQQSHAILNSTALMAAGRSAVQSLADHLQPSEVAA